MQSPLARMLPLALLVLAFAIGMATLLNSFKFEATFDRLQRSRIASVGSDVADAASRSAALGISLENMAALAELLKRQSGTDRLIAGIDVFGEDGQVLHSSEDARRGATVPYAWLAAMRRPGAREFFAREPGYFVAGAPIRNSFDVVLGGVAVRYAREPHDRSAALARRTFAEYGAIAFAVAALLCSAMLAWLVSRLRRVLDA